MPKGILKLEISRYDQISSGRPLENAFTNNTGSYCELESHNNVLMLASGEIYKASHELVTWYKRSYYNSLATDIVVIIDHTNKTAFIPENPDEYHDTHERKWHRFKVTLYHQNQQKEFAAFGEEYKLSEIKVHADDLIEKYVPASDIKKASWETSGRTYIKQLGDYSVSIYVIP